jgi:hypothetical protein
MGRVSQPTRHLDSATQTSLLTSVRTHGTHTVNPALTFTHVLGEALLPVELRQLLLQRSPSRLPTPNDAGSRTPVLSCHASSQWKHCWKDRAEPSKQQRTSSFSSITRHVTYWPAVSNHYLGCCALAVCDHIRQLLLRSAEHLERALLSHNLGENTAT